MATLRAWLETFGALHGLTLKIETHPEGGFSAQYEPMVEVKGDGVLCAAWGWGDTQAEAVLSYAKKISLRTLVTGAYSWGRREFIAWPFGDLKGVRKWIEPRDGSSSKSRG